jgi:ATP-dependent DNA helicase RecQ
LKMTPHEILKKYFGYRSFREHQLEIIETVIDARDAFVLMPTGSGKSVCYQIPSMIRPGIGIVISPLIALMENQVSALQQNGVAAAVLNSSLSASETARVFRQVRSGGLDILYVAPERLLMPSFREFLENLPIAMFAIDEAHCVSQWGHDFRPEYLQIADVTRRFEGVPRMALTATADPQTRQDILEKLEMPRARRFISSFDRPNIRYRILLKNNDKKQLLDFLKTAHSNDAGIVYVRTRARADQIAQWLQSRQVDALAYHAGLDNRVRTEHQRRFLESESLVMVATIAFGMGIDKPDVRFVAHLDLPASLEAYYQETGRAGRDGRPADAWMLYALSDVVAMRILQESSTGDENFKMTLGRKRDALLGYCETVTCRRVSLLEYFGETYAAPACGNCDNCLQAVETWDGTEAAQKALSCVYRTGQRFGAAHLTDVLTGNRTDRVRGLGHDRLKTFGVGADLAPAVWRSVYRQLMAAGLLSAGMTKISGFRLTRESWPVLRGEREILFRKDPRPVNVRKPPASRPPAPKDALDESARPLFERLRRLRAEIAGALKVPPYVIFHDRTLREMAALEPAEHEDLLRITGIGEKKADRFGKRFLAAISDHNAGRLEAPSKNGPE